jgi:hypothetical protein
MSYSKSDIGLVAGALMSFVFTVLAIFRPNDVLPPNDQAQLTASVVILVTFVLSFTGNRVGKHISGAR